MAVGVKITKVTSQEKPIGIECVAGLILILEVSNGDVTLHANFANLSSTQGLAGIASDDADINSGKRTAHSGASYLQGLGCICDTAVSVCLREAVDVADFARAEVDDAHYLLWRTDGAARAQTGEVIIASVGMVEKRLRHVGRPVKQRATLGADEA